MPRWRVVVPGLVLAAVCAVACSGSPPHHTVAGRHLGSGAGRLPFPPRGGGLNPRSGRALLPVVTSSCRPGVNAPDFWIVSAHGLSVMAAAAPEQVRYAFKPANLFLLGGTGQPGSPVGQPVAVFQSYARLAMAIAGHQIPASVRWLLYDNEQWAATPRNEQRDPARYESLFAGLAHRHGYRVILAPAQDLALGSGRSRLPPGTPAWRRYLSMGLPAASARAGDIFDIQAQAYELPEFRGQHLYLRVIRAAIAQARAVNPGITIFAGISANRVVSASDMHADFLAARGLVAGFWLNVDYQQGWQRRLARQFLGGLPGPAAASGRTCARSVGGAPAQADDVAGRAPAPAANVSRAAVVTAPSLYRFASPNG